MRPPNPSPVAPFSCFAHWRLKSALVLLGLCWTAHAQFYSVTCLGTLGGTNGMAYGINNHEQIVGAAQGSMGNFHAFMFDAGRMMDLGTLGGSNSWAYGINDNGWMVGAAGLSMSNVHAFLCTNALLNSTMMDLGTLGGSNSMAWMLNLEGNVVGWASMTNGHHHAFFMTNSIMGEMMDLGTAGGTNSEAYCINSNRMLVGSAMMSTGDPEPIMSSNALFGSASMMTMGMGGMQASGGMAWAVNNLGDTAGQADMAAGNHHATVSGSGGMMGQRTVDLGTLGGTNSIAYCVSDTRSVVGTAQASDGKMHAFIVMNALGSMVQMLDLNSVIPTDSGWELMEARSMNAAGQIVGWGMFGGHTNAFLLTPVSAPVKVASAPGPQIGAPGSSCSLQIQMSASEPLTFQWLHNGMPIAGATNSTLGLPGMMTADSGLYSVVVRNSVGTVANASTSVSLFGMRHVGGSAQLTIAAAAGAKFEIDSTKALAPGAIWQSVTNLTMSAPMTQIAVAPEPGTSMRFYRAILVP